MAQQAADASQPWAPSPVQPWVIKPQGKARSLSALPPPGQHPRVLFSPCDRTDLVSRALGGNAASAAAGLEPHALESDVRAGQRAFADLETKVNASVYGPVQDAPVRRLLELLACGESPPGAQGPRTSRKDLSPSQVLDSILALVADQDDPSRVLRGSFYTQLYEKNLGPTLAFAQLLGSFWGNARLVPAGGEDSTPEFAAKFLFCSMEGGLPETRSPAYVALKEAAYVAWIRGEEERLAWLGGVLSMAARVHLLWYSVPGDELTKLCGGPVGYDKDVDDSVCQHLALAYDLLHGSMSEGERLGPRRLLLTMGKRRVLTSLWVSGFLRGTAAGLSHTYSTGTFGVMTSVWLMAQSAVEGEGVQAECDAEGKEEHPALEHDLEAQQFNCEGVKYWLAHGAVWDPTGPSRECPGYFATAMRFGTFPALAAARRGYDIFGSSTNFYAQISEILQTSAAWFDAQMCLGGHDGMGYCGGFGQSEYFLIGKYMFPNDPAMDYIFQAINTNVKGQVGVSGLNKMPFQTAVFGMNVPSARIPLGEAAAAASMPRANFANGRGMGTARSDWEDPTGALLYFESRPDLYNLGHGHSNRNHFFFSSHNRIWISGGQYHNTEPEAHSSVLIDGVGQGGCHTSRSPAEFAKCWSHVPGKMVETFDSPKLTYFLGCAKAAYTYVNNAPLYALGRPDPKNPVATPYTWREFFLTPPDFGLSCFYDPKTKTTSWREDSKWADYPVPAAGEFNPVEFAFRTACLVRGPQPYAVIVDNIRKDSQPHTYTWVANTTIPYLSGSGYKQAICLLQPEDFGIEDPANQAVFARGEDVDPTTGKVLPGRPLLLLSVLHSEGTPGGAIRLVHVEKGFPEKLDCASAFEYDRIEIERCGCVEPKFKVLLFPFLEGQGPPVGEFDAETNVAKVGLKGGALDTVRFLEEGNKTSVVVT